MRCFAKHYHDGLIFSSLPPSVDVKYKTILVDPFGPHHRKESQSGVHVAGPGSTFWAVKYFQGLENQRETVPSPKGEGMLFPVSSPVTLNTNQARLNRVKIQIYTQMI